LLDFFLRKYIIIEMPRREKSIKEKDARLRLNEISGRNSKMTNEVLVCEKVGLKKDFSQGMLFRLQEKSIPYQKV